MDKDNDKIEFPVYILNAFITGENEPFSGNPAAVFFLNYDDNISDEVKQKMAAEMNVSDTAFVAQGWRKESDLDSMSSRRWTLRWFTPAVEAPLCGHATLATASVIFQDILKIDPASETTSTLRFESKFSGPLGATITWEDGLININLPSNPTIPYPKQGNAWIPQLTAETLGKSLPVELVEEVQYSPTTKATVLRLKDTGNGQLANEELIRSLRPNFQAMAAVKGTWDLPLHYVIVTIRGDPKDPQGPHFYSRFFAPATGTDEDPVTGTAHTILTPFWNKQFEKEGLDIKKFIAKQTSQRTGTLICTLDGDRVHLAGTAKLVLKGSFFV